MRTKQNISTICYNTDKFLKFQLDELISSNLIDFYAFCRHKKECDEKKDHIHLFLMPSKQIETSDLNVRFTEKEKDKDIYTGTCGIWHTVGKNNTSDWLLYTLHDPVYLKIKGCTDRVYAYTLDDFITSSIDGLNELYYDALHTSKCYFDKHIRDKILESKNPHQTGVELVKNGYVPLSSACSYHHFLQMID